MKSKTEYFCTFDPNTGERTGSYVQGVTNVPSGAIQVSKEDFDTYNSNPLARYDWDTKSITVVSPLLDKSIEELASLAVTKIDNNTATKITSGFSIQLQDKHVVFDSDFFSQLYYLNCYMIALKDPESTCDVHGYVAGMKTKTLFKVNADELCTIYMACMNHIEKCKKEGWDKKDYVNSSERSIEELRSYVSRL